MRLLLDTHTLIWSYSNVLKLSARAANSIIDPVNTIFVSAASHWEIAIKVSTGKLQLGEPVEDFIQHAIFDQGFVLLGIEPQFSFEVARLPYPLKNHRDPFDRLLIAQAIVDQLTIISADTHFDAYAVTRAW